MRGLALAGLSMLVCATGAALPGPASAAAGDLVRLAASPDSGIPGRSLGTLPGNRRIHITVALRPRDPAALRAYALEVSDPGSPFYAAYLTPPEFAQRFGASPAELRAVRASLAAHGLRPGATAINRLSIPVTDTVAAIQRAFRVRLERIRLARGGQAVTASAPPAVDRRIAPGVQAVIGLSSVGAPHPLLIGSAAGHSGRRSALRPHVQTGGPQPCSAASGAAAQNGAYTADQIATAYGFPGLYGAGDQGQGVTIAEYELEPNDPADIAAYQACYGTHAAVSYVQIDGGAGSGGGTGEAALDIENAIGLAPRANYLVYQGPNANQSVPGSGPYDLFAAIINQDRANVVSVSWGECETLEGAAGAQSESTLFEQAAVQGQSIVAASGDQGSEDCNGANNLPDPSLAVDDPASQPFVTGVGGTSITQAGPPPAQAVWNGGGNPTVLAPSQSGAGGGGTSALWTMPGYQSRAAPALGVVNSRSSSSSCGASSGFCREVPDISADADPATGYVIYYNGSGGNPTAGAGWQAVGGTSAASPLWAALLALADASPACRESSVGFINPALYKAASGNYASILFDVTSGNNDFTGTNFGKYPATAGYDMATGLGTPNASPLAAALCADTLRIRTPPTQRVTLGQPVSLRLTTTGPVSGGLTWVSSGLPAGLTVSKSSGVITGRPTKLGTFTAAVGVVDSMLAVRATAFSWVIQGPPRILTATIGGRARPRLRVALAAGRGAPGLRSLAVSLPRGLRFSDRRVSLTGPGGQHLAFKARILGGRLIVSVPSAPRQLTLLAAYPSLRSSGAGARGRSRVVITVSDSRGHSSLLRAILRRRG